jgi:hypothetical protein
MSTAGIEKESSNPEPISEWRLAGLYVLVMVPLWLVGMILLMAGAWVFGFRNPVPGLLGGVGGLSFLAAHFLIDRSLKRRGLSRSGRTVEVWRSNSADGELATGPGPEAESDEMDGDRVGIRLRPRWLAKIGGSCLLLSLLVGVLVLVDPSLRKDNVWAYALIVIPAFVGALALYVRWRGTPRAWADASGFTAVPFGAFGHRFVPWSLVSSCEIETYHAIRGETTALFVTLEDFNGEPLARRERRMRGCHRGRLRLRRLAGLVTAIVPLGPALRLLKVRGGGAADVSSHPMATQTDRRRA